jgi:hypothetical protein
VFVEVHELIVVVTADKVILILLFDDILDEVNIG